MVLTEVYIPSINKYFDFQLDEKMKVRDAAMEILSIVSSSESINMNPGDSEPLICLMDMRTMLPRGMRLMDCGVKAGSRLMLL